MGNIVTTEDDLRDLVSHYLCQESFAFDVETIGEDRGRALTATVAWIAFASAERTDVVPLGHPHGELVKETPTLLAAGRRKLAAGRSLEDLPPSVFSKKTTVKHWGDPPEQLDRATAFKILQPLFSSTSTKIGHNIRFDIHATNKYLDESVSGPYFDTMIASWLLDATLRGRLSLKDCAKRELGLEMEKGVGKDISQHSFIEVAKYAALDARATFDLYRALMDKFQQGTPELRRLLELEMCVLYPVLEMESSGVRIDRDRLTALGKSMAVDIETIEATLNRHVGRTFNMRSHREKQQLLFTPRSEGGLGLKPIKTTDTGLPSVDRESLDKLSQKAKGKAAEVLKYLRLHQDKTKILGTYITPYLGDGKTLGLLDTGAVPGRLYAQFDQHGTESGRFSSRNPNLQNIPSRTEDGRKIREMFIPDPGCKFVVADYSQIEPRIIASLSGDPTMLRAYRDNEDVYLVVANRLGVDRRDGKELVLAIAYGIGPQLIATKIGKSVSEARDLMNFFSQKFPSLAKHKTRVLMRAKKNGYSETVFGRRRLLPDINNRHDPEARSRAERQAYNHLIQGSAADIMKIALINIHAELPDGVRLLMTVHDEVVVQAPEEMVDSVAAVIRTEMESSAPSQIKVPLIADVKVAANWAEGK